MPNLTLLVVDVPSSLGSRVLYSILAVSRTAQFYEEISNVEGQQLSVEILLLFSSPLFFFRFFR